MNYYYLQKYEKFYNFREFDTFFLKYFAVEAGSLTHKI